MIERPLENAVCVRTGARLHFGLLSFGDTGGRQFGGLGAMIDRPGFDLLAEPGVPDEIIAPPEWVPRITSLLQQVRSSGPGPSPGVPLRLTLRQAPPAHAGFGSGTQLGLAVARLVTTLQGEAPLSVLELARRAGRGARSAIGVHGFERGGLLLEGGKLPSQSVSPLVAHTALPPNWRYVLIRPRGTAGVSGATEVAAFSRLPAMPAATTDRLCGLAVRDLIPAAMERDAERFSAALWEFGTIVGRFFSPVQGGIFAHPQMGALAERLRESGFPGVAQTSWGPTLVVVCGDAAAAERLVDWLTTEPAAHDCEIVTACGLNDGARVEPTGV